MHKKTTTILVSNNNVSTIDRCIESIAENNVDFIVIMDNGSTDNTYDLLCKKFGAIGVPNKYECLYKKIPTFIFKKQKQNMSILINEAITMFAEKTDYFGIIEGNYYYCADTIKKINEIFNKYNYISAIVSNFILDNPKQTIIKRSFDISSFVNNYDYDLNMFLKSESFFKLKRLFDPNYDLMCDYEMLLTLVNLGIIYHSADFLFHKHYKTDENLDQKRKILLEINKAKNVKL